MGLSLQLGAVRLLCFVNFVVGGPKYFFKKSWEDDLTPI